MPVLVALVGGSHQDYRYRRGMGGVLPEDMDRRTSNVPFVAMVTGAQEKGGVGDAVGKMIDEAKGLNAAAAVAVAVGMALRRGK